MHTLQHSHATTANMTPKFMQTSTMKALLRRKGDRSKLARRGKQIATEFHYFPMLPLELRLIIWHMALEEQRIVVGKLALIHNGSIGQGQHQMLAGHGPTLSLLFVNIEAREEALRVLTNFTFEGVRPAQQLLRINAPVDILYLHNEQIVQMRDQHFGIDYDPTVRIKRLALDISAFGILYTFEALISAWDGILFKLWQLGTEEVYMVQDMPDQIMRRDIVFIKPKKRPLDVLSRTLSQEPPFLNWSRQSIRGLFYSRRRSSTTKLEINLWVTAVASMYKVHRDIQALSSLGMSACVPLTISYQLIEVLGPDDEYLTLLTRFMTEFLDGTWNIPTFKHVSASTIEEENRKARSLVQRLKWWRN